MNIILFTFFFYPCTTMFHYHKISVALGQSIYSYYTRSFRVTETF